MLTLTSEKIQAYIRIALYHLGAGLMTSGYLSSGKWEIISGVVLNALTFVWTLWGQRLIAKINELAKTPNLIIIAPPAEAAAAPAANVVATIPQAQAVAASQAAVTAANSP